MFTVSLIEAFERISRLSASGRAESVRLVPIAVGDVSGKKTIKSNFSGWLRFDGTNVIADAYMKVGDLSPRNEARRWLFVVSLQDWFSWISIFRKLSFAPDIRSRSIKV